MNRSGAVAVSAPGKLILMGEHAVVYGRPALVAAVDLRVTARLSPLAGKEVHLDLPGLGISGRSSWSELRAYAREIRARWQDYARRPAAAGFRAMRGDEPAHVVKVALGETAELLVAELGVPLCGGRLLVTSELPIGSGFGSSAATATAAVAACLAFHRVAAAPQLLERLTTEVERRQHGLPSGVDAATVLRGGVLWARKLQESGLAIEPLAPRSSLLERLRVYDSGSPAEPTGAVVAAVREIWNRDPHGTASILDRMEAAVRAFRDELEAETEDAERALHSIREHEACLEALGVVPDETRTVIRAIEREGGAAKISGAGSLRGPGGGSLLVYHPEADRIAGWACLRPFVFYPVHLGAPGFREEASG